MALPPDLCDAVAWHIRDECALAAYAAQSHAHAAVALAGPARPPACRRTDCIGRLKNTGHLAHLYVAAVDARGAAGARRLLWAAHADETRCNRGVYDGTNWRRLFIYDVVILAILHALVHENIEAAQWMYNRYQGGCLRLCMITCPLLGLHPNDFLLDALAATCNETVFAWTQRLMHRDINFAERSARLARERNLGRAANPQ
jgi:hypothetical protein